MEISLLILLSLTPLLLSLLTPTTALDVTANGMEVILQHEVENILVATDFSTVQKQISEMRAGLQKLSKTREPLTGHSWTL